MMMVCPITRDAHVNALLPPLPLPRWALDASFRPLSPCIPLSNLFSKLIFLRSTCSFGSCSIADGVLRRYWAWWMREFGWLECKIFVIIRAGGEL